MRLGILLLLAAPGCGLYFHDNHASGDDTYVPPTPAPPDAGMAYPIPDAAPQARCGDGMRSPGEICFGPVQQLDGGGAVLSARALDYDGDGVLDLVYANTDHLGWRRGDGHGHFEMPQIGPAVSAWYIASGDVAGDGSLSLVTAGRDQLAVWHRLGADWVQTAQVALTDPTTGVEVGNMDGYPGDEIAITGASSYAIYQLVNASLHRLYSETNSLAVNALGMGDADDDGKQDGLLSATSAGWVYYGGVGGVHGIHGYGVSGMEATAMAAADLDGDGNTDLALTQVNPAGIVLVVDGEFWASDLTDAPRFVDTANLDGDAGREIVVASPRAQSVSALDVGNWITAGPVVTLDEPMTAIHFDGDLDGDGVADLVVTLSDRIAIVPSGAP